MNFKRINSTSHNINVVIFPDHVQVDTGIITAEGDTEKTIYQTTSLIDTVDGEYATEMAIGRAVIEMLNSRKAVSHKCCKLVSLDKPTPALFDKTP